VVTDPSSQRYSARRDLSPIAWHRHDPALLIDNRRPQARIEQGGCRVDWKLELVVVPVSDIDRAKAFYMERAGFKLNVDHRAGEDFRVVQLTPPGSACSIALMKNASAGSLQGLHLIVPDIDSASAELKQRGVDVTDIFHFEGATQAPGPDPQRGDYNSFITFSDPDGNGWLVQEVRRTPAGDR
jgi:catechol 2,3-dioxygenase-like lactoylglutathione lyase family enzyme